MSTTSRGPSTRCSTPPASRAYTYSGDTCPTAQSFLETFIRWSSFCEKYQPEHCALAAEIVREKLMRQVGDELPYRATVAIDRFRDEQEPYEIDATIYVERDGQKAIVIGKGGARLKSIGQEARTDIEELLGKHVMLRLWVKVRPGWTADEAQLRRLGYD